ncbi:MAG TPA: extracellular solute-binding protein [Tepidisphaeraceae bacterium]|nr:extracellular solute-binding protein [Tepidisphaeraceae bacterium]
MRRYVFIILFFVVLVSPFVLRKAVGRPAVEHTAKDEAELVIISPHVEGIRREFADAFKAWHQHHYGTPVEIDYRNYGGASEIVRFFEASKPLFRQLGTYKIDLVWGGGDYLFDQQLKKPGYLEPVAIDPAIMRKAFPKPDLGGVALYDPSNPPQWFGVVLASFGIAYNRDVCRHLGVPEPKTWKDLADARYRNWLVLADPTRSASAKQAFMTIVEYAMAQAKAAGRSEDDGWADGMGLVRQIAANARQFTDGSASIPGVISSGDAAAGMAIDFYGRSQVDAVGEARMGYVEPAGATAINPDPVAMVKGAPHREIAKHFIEFLLSEKAQKLWNTRAGAPGGPKQTSLRRLPIMPSVYEHDENFTDKVNPFTESGGFNKSNAREATFGILGELIQFSCMDLLDDLRETREAILASPISEELDKQLGRFPFNQKEALARMKAWKSSPPAERLALQRRWIDEFRQEYARLRAAAEK